MEEEIWKAIPECSGYEASNFGNIKSLKRKQSRILKSYTNKQGYREVNIGKPDNHKRVTYLIMLTFVGPRPEGMEICHNDGNSSNDRLENLRYDTHQENMNDRTKHGRNIGPKRTKPIYIPKYKHLDPDAVKSIREIYYSGEMSLSQLGKMYKKHPSAISRIVNNLTHAS